MTDETEASPRTGLRPWHLAAAAASAPALATLVAFLGRFWWFFDLFSHFRVQYLAGLALTGAVLLALGRWKPALAAGLLACINLAYVAPLYLGAPPRAPGDDPGLRAVVFNVGRAHPDSVRPFLRSVDADIVVLLEIDRGWVGALEELAKTNPHVCTRVRQDSFGIGLYSRLPLTEARIAEIGRADVPSVLAMARTEAGPLRIIGTHPVPPIGARLSRRRNRQLRQLAGHVPPDMSTILLGDLNNTPWNHHFRALLRRSGLQDSARGFGVQPTWPTAHFLLRVPIDHCLHSPDLRVLRRRVGPDLGSDHYPVIVDLLLPDAPTGTGRN
jgi:endonuclease/exonuclease/phosphatase (EEP) superfamily protein YafD